MTIPIHPCTHPNLRSFTFKDGKTIHMCPSVLTKTFPNGYVAEYSCDHLGPDRRSILRGVTKVVLKEKSDG